MAKMITMPPGRTHGKSVGFHAERERTKLTGKLIKKETVGGITTETYQRHDDGRKWLFAYRAKNGLISSTVDKSKRLAESLTL